MARALNSSRLIPTSTFYRPVNGNNDDDDDEGETEERNSRPQYYDSGRGGYNAVKRYEDDDDNDDENVLADVKHYNAEYHHLIHQRDVRNVYGGAVETMTIVAFLIGWIAMGGIVIAAPTRHVISEMSPSIYNTFLMMNQNETMLANCDDGKLTGELKSGTVWACFTNASVYMIRFLFFLHLVCDALKDYSVFKTNPMYVKLRHTGDLDNFDKAKDVSLLLIRLMLLPMALVQLITAIILYKISQNVRGSKLCIKLYLYLILTLLQTLVTVFTACLAVARSCSKSTASSIKCQRKTGTILKRLTTPTRNPHPSHTSSSSSSVPRQSVAISHMTSRSTPEIHLTHTAPITHTHTVKPTS